MSICRLILKCKVSLCMHPIPSIITVPLSSSASQANVRDITGWTIRTVDFSYTLYTHTICMTHIVRIGLVHLRSGVRCRRRSPVTFSRPTQYLGSKRTCSSVHITFGIWACPVRYSSTVPGPVRYQWFASCFIVALAIGIMFTARCTTMQSAVLRLRRLSVRPSVRL